MVEMPDAPAINSYTLILVTQKYWKVSTDP